MSEEDDARFWGEVEEAVELVQDDQPLEALVELRKVVAASPKNPYAYHWLGVALYEAGQLEPARDAYRAALALSPQYLGARIHLSHTLRQLGDARAALQQAETAHRQKPDDPEVWHALGLACLGRGDKDGARRWLMAFLDSTPELEVSLEVRALMRQHGLEEG
ncbi:MAG: tetratricopeptide repeat protein [Myxococcales bacterium]|nr:tetratricopeptide repeat protein [Myxococcales bacterium]